MSLVINMASGVDITLFIVTFMSSSSAVGVPTYLE